MVPLLVQNRVPAGFETEDKLDVSLRPDEVCILILFWVYSHWFLYFHPVLCIFTMFSCILILFCIF